MSKVSLWALARISSALLAFPLAVQAVPVTYDLSFTTTGQSIWDTGESFTLDKSTFLGAAWEDQTVSINAIAFEGETIVNPLRTAYDAAFSACTALFSSSACIMLTAT